ncbi:hypothetical protein FWP33_07705 [Vibrio parahaemolyticus]|uniref:Uncharacterized protein n=2 Tax=Vibrio harveyi group TaxID=717610 RepID=A0A9Q3UCK5_VIBPH|nr:hypothetical protein [Vibrio parahaemolyticus]ELA8176636.1 hypothetical protein [Vibrio alginolyticus]CAH1598560.1 hypothetical protein THF1C08_50162 [Vibrio jasicida]EGQ9742405.1 hypothetical protein [Vibrio parahaemolyticus]EJE4724505.1 hypothetical protein [Vibrio parahaemolyticus]MCC3804061.1 hypothetical protein [Vibrio parahaemolyticus]
MVNLIYDLMECEAENPIQKSFIIEKGLKSGMCVLFQLNEDSIAESANFCCCSYEEMNTEIQRLKQLGIIVSARGYVENGRVDDWTFNFAGRFGMTNFVQKFN